MLVVTYPRTGATKFCIDLSSNTGLEFKGELYPACIKEIGRPYPKSFVHETGFQPVIDPITFVDMIKSNNNSILMINHGSYLVAPKADYIVLRKDILAALLSFGNLLYRSDPEIVPRELRFFSTWNLFDEAYGLVVYCTETLSSREKIVWFEDLYPNHRPHYENAQVWDHLGYFTDLIDVSDIQERLNTLYMEKV